MKKKLQFSILLMIVFQFANATQYYVSIYGKDYNSGLNTSSSGAWRTLTYADTQVKAGDVVCVMNGTYDPFVITTSGSASGGYITYKPLSGHHPKVSCSSAGAWNLVKILASYIIWDGIEVVGINQSIDLAKAIDNYNNIEALLQYYKIDDIPQSEWDKTVGTITNGISIGENKRAAVTNITVKNCSVHDCAGAGLDARNSDNILFENNVVYNNCWFTMWASSGISFIYQSGYGTSIARGNTVYNNYTQVKWAGHYNESDGNGIIIDINDGLDYPKYNGYFTIENNLVFDNGGRGLYVMNAQNATVRNNTSFKNSKSWFSAEGEMVIHNSNNVAFINNIAWADNTYYATNYALNDKGGWGWNSNITWQNNLTYNGTDGQSSVNLSNTSTTSINNSNKLGVNPLLVNPYQWGGDFHTSSGSPARNAGTSVYGASWYDLDYNIRVQGTIDIGCYEKDTAIGRIASEVEASTETQLKVFPNPATDGVVTIQLVGFNKEKVQLSILDMQGRSLLDRSVTDEYDINISTTNMLKAGIYLVKAQGQNSTLVQKLFVK